MLLSFFFYIFTLFSKTIFFTFHIQHKEFRSTNPRNIPYPTVNKPIYWDCQQETPRCLGHYLKLEINNERILLPDIFDFKGRFIDALERQGIILKLKFESEKYYLPHRIKYLRGKNKQRKIFQGHKIGPALKQ